MHPGFSISFLIKKNQSVSIHHTRVFLYPFVSSITVAIFPEGKFRYVPNIFIYGMYYKKYAEFKTLDTII